MAKKEVRLLNLLRLTSHTTVSLHLSRLKKKMEDVMAKIKKVVVEAFLSKLKAALEVAKKTAGVQCHAASMCCCCCCC